jgi:hypothetical protein
MALVPRKPSPQIIPKNAVIIAAGSIHKVEENDKEIIIRLKKIDLGTPKNPPKAVAYPMDLAGQAVKLSPRPVARGGFGAVYKGKCRGEAVIFLFFHFSILTLSPAGGD